MACLSAFRKQCLFAIGPVKVESVFCGIVRHKISANFSQLRYNACLHLLRNEWQTIWQSPQEIVYNDFSVKVMCIFMIN